MAGKEEENRVFVGGLAIHTKAHHLAEAFSRFGTVLETEIAMDRKTGRLRGFGFITFTNPHAVHAAIGHMHNTELHGQIIRVSRAYHRISSYDGHNYNHGNAGTSGKYSYFNHTSGKYSNDKNHISYFNPYEDCYSGNEGKSGNYHKNFRYYTPFKGCYDGSDDANGKSRNNNKTSSYFPPYDDCYGKNRSNGCFNCGRTGHWARDCTYPRDDEFDDHYSCYQFYDEDCANQQRQNGGNSRGNKCFNCGRPGHWAHDCLKQRDGRPGDLRGKRPVSPDAVDYGDYDQLDYDDFTIYCDYCEDFGHFILECPNLGCCSASHPKYCDCDGGPYLGEGRFDGSCLQCGGHSLWSVQGNPNSSTREHGESSCGPRISGKRYDGRPQGYYNDQYRYSSGIADFSNSAGKNSRNYDLFGLSQFEEESFDAYGQLGKNNGRNLPHGTRFHSSSRRNRRHYDAFEEDALFEEGVFKNHGQQGNCNRRTMPPEAVMGGERSGSRQNRDRKNDQYDRIGENENDGELNEGRNVCGHNAGAQRQRSGPHASSRRPTGGSSRRPRNGAQGVNSVGHDSRDDVNERRRRGRDPVNVFIIVERGGRS